MFFRRLMALFIILLMLAGCSHRQKRPVSVTTPIPRSTGQYAEHFSDGNNPAIEADYLIYLPENYSHSNKKFPLIIFLHGSSARGNNLELVRKYGIPSTLEKKRNFPFIVLSPQCPANQYWDIKMLNALLTSVETKYRVDKEKVYLTGTSMGGYGAWNWGCSNPERFAAIAPVCGGGNPRLAYKLKNTPVWVFHGARDTVVSPAKSEAMVEAIKKAGGNVKFTLYPDLGHYCWAELYKGNELYDWFLAHKLNHKM
jgi:predicted peptidase